MRIRNLEIQSSQLLSENVALREQVADLQGRLDGKPVRNAVPSDIVSSVKTRLEEKMQDLAQLVAELGDSTRARPCAAKRHTVNTNSLQEWRDAAAAAMAEAGPQYRLETIREGKGFPRKTLNAEEIGNIVNASESPDIGPPPVSRFDEIDPVKFDPPPSKTDEIQLENQDTDGLATPLSINLETRRKRKDGQPRLDIRRLSVFQPSGPDSTESQDSDAPQTQVLPIRAGAKRKMSAREVDDQPAAAGLATSKETFQFNRRAATARPLETLNPEERKKPQSQSSDRRALSTKSANVDVVNSPKKVVHNKHHKGSETGGVEKPALTVPDLEERKNRTRRPKADTRDSIEQVISIPEPTPPAIMELPDESVDLPPKTPATHDLFSPTSTEASAGALRDTPEPNITHGDASGTGRAGRRARSQVNYAEPSLNTKMRRPGKELADAVGKQGRPVAVRAEPRFKRDPEESTTSADEWKGISALPGDGKDKAAEMIGEPNSPLRDKTLSLSQALRDRREKETLEAAREAEQQTAQDAINDAAEDVPGPAALTSVMRKRLGRAAQVLPASVSEAKLDGMTDEKRDSLAIFDFNDSSPPKAAPVSSEQAARARSSRRHSSVPAAPLSSELRRGLSEGLPAYSKTALATEKLKSGAAAVASTADSLSAARRDRIASRRRSMML